MTKRRRAYDAGHRAKFLVVVDDTPECDRAVYFAARRAARTGVALIMVAVVPEGEYQHWLGVGDVMRAEAEEEANHQLDAMAARAREIAGISSEKVVRIGNKADEVVALILEQDEDIALLVLAAGTDSEGPGPLVSSLSTRGGSFPIPIAVVPGHLTDEDIDALA